MLGYAKIGAVLAACAVVAYLCFWLYDTGGKNERARIDGENINAAQQANEAAMSWRECRNLDGVYHFDTGKCEWASAVHR